jgi:hypothetical protein
MNFRAAAAILISASLFSTKAYAEESFWERAFPQELEYGSLTHLNQKLLSTYQPGAGAGLAMLTYGMTPRNSLSNMLANQRESLAVAAATARLDNARLRSEIGTIQRELAEARGNLLHYVSENDPEYLSVNDTRRDPNRVAQYEQMRARLHARVTSLEASERTFVQRLSQPDLQYGRILSDERARINSGRNLTEAESSSLNRITRNRYIARTIVAAGLYSLVDGLARLATVINERDPGYFPAIRLGTEAVKVLVQEGQELLESQRGGSPPLLSPAR